MKYIVSIDYKEFEFDNGTTALSFAELAVCKSKDYVKVSVLVKEDSNA